MPDLIKINVGCGHGEDVLPGWVNVDAVPGKGVDVVADACHLPFADESVVAVRCSHMIEHLTKPELEAFAAECYRVLAPEGMVEVIAPSFAKIVEIYWPERQTAAMPTENFVITPVDWLDNMLYGRHLHQQDFHRQGIYPQKLRQIFGQFERHEFHEQSRPCSRWELVMTCAKPGIPLCSIVMSTRNKSKELDATLASIRRQVVPFSYEIIVVDDGSTDATPAVCQKHDVRYIRLENPRYRNPSKARNAGYRAAKGKVIICQSDDVIHMSDNAVEQLTLGLQPGEFFLAKVLNYQYESDRPLSQVAEYCSPQTKRPYFFLGAILRSDLYRAGGCDEEFVEPCYDDNWFADCLILGLKLTPRYSDAIVAHHQAHDRSKNSHVNEYKSRDLYQQKLKMARATGEYVASGGPWLERGDPSPPPPPPISLPSTVVASVGRIPNRMSFFWASDRMSWLRFITLYSFRRHNPTWEMVVYRSQTRGGKQWKSDEQQDAQTYVGPDYWKFVADLNVEVVDWLPPFEDMAPAHASDLCEWGLLSEGGGWYSDMDVLYVAPMPSINADVVVCFPGGFVAIGLVGAAPRNLLFKTLSQVASESYSRTGYQSTGADAIYRLAGVGPKWGQIDSPGDKALVSLRRLYPSLKIADLPPRTIYPWTFVQLSMMFSSLNSPPQGCVGIHWFGGSPIAQQWNCHLTAENYARSDNTICHQMAKLLGSTLSAPVPIPAPAPVISTKVRTSICIATYDKPSALRETLRSIFQQSVPFAYEVIVVDDGSPGTKTAQVCQEFPQVRYSRIARQPTYRNPAAARNVAYRMARGDIVICQSDDVIHHSPDAILRLTEDLREGEFLIATVMNVNGQGKPVGLSGFGQRGAGIQMLTGSQNPRPLFFLGSLWRKDLYAVGGNDEGFTGPGREDVWFADCLTHGRKLSHRFLKNVMGHHQDHPRELDADQVGQSVQLYSSRVEAAKAGRRPWQGGDPWPL